MKVLWLIVAVTLGIVAVVFMWRRDFDSAFVAAVLGIVAWFLNFRAQAKAATVAIDAQQEDDQQNHAN